MREVRYSKERWELLRRLRRRARRVIETLSELGMEGWVHGSVARGDVRKGSDVDVFVPHTTSPHVVDALVESSPYPVLKVVATLPTPRDCVRVKVLMERNVEVVVPVTAPSDRELEFYDFSGKLTPRELERDERVPGVDKRLRMIEPRPWGHLEYSIIGREGEVAAKLGISTQLVNERIKALTRRDKVGVQGVHAKVEGPPGEPTVELLRRLARSNPKAAEKLADLGV
ncbi:nucleotidyltransferase domain-containing protein [Methanopyrus sp.]